MASLNEFPELKAVFDKLMAERDELRAETKPLHDEYDRLHAQIAPLELRMRELAKQFHAVERPRLVEVEQQLSAITRATGGHRLVNEGPA